MISVIIDIGGKQYTASADMTPTVVQKVMNKINAEVIAKRILENLFWQAAKNAEPELAATLKRMVN